MPKQLRTIKQYHGGLINVTDPRDIPDNAAVHIENMIVDKVGRLQQAGTTVKNNVSETPAANFNALDITYIKDNLIDFANGTELYIFNSDRVFDEGTTVLTGSNCLVWTNPKSGWIYFFDLAQPLTTFWTTMHPTSLGQASAPNIAVGGIPALISKLGPSLTYPTSPCYYSADGQLRVVNATFDEATYVGTNTAEGQGADAWPSSSCNEGVSGHSTQILCRYNGDYEHSNYSAGASSMWIGYIDKGYLNNDVDVNLWHALPLEIKTPTVGATTSGATIVTGVGTDNTHVDPGAGEIKIKTTFNTNGNGSLLLAGRKFYITFTYDGVQETLPSVPVEEVGLTLPVITEVTTARIEYDTETITASMITDISDWPDEGSFEVEDEDGYEQLLTYESITTNNQFNGVDGWFGDGGFQLSGALADDGWTDIEPGRLKLEATNVGDGEGLEIGNVIIIAGSAEDYIDGSWTVLDVEVTDTPAAGDGTFTIGYDNEENEYDFGAGMTWTHGQDEHNIASGSTFTLVRKDGDLGIDITLYAMRLNAYTLFPEINGGNRITHVNLYSNRFEEDGTTIAEEDFAHVATWDLQEGFLKPDNVWNPWTGSTGTVYACGAGGFINQFATSYEMRTGVNPRVKSINARFKTAVVANRRTYVGNVFMLDSSGAATKYGDRMLKSVPGSLDVFPTGEFIDVAIRDGDEIVKLEEFGGKILQFKKKALYAINISGDFEYLEATYKYRGIDHKACASRTDQGVAFVNETGAYIYDGQQVTSLSKGKIDIGSIYSTMKIAKTDPGMIVSYDAQNGQILFITPPDIGNTAGYGTAYIFHMHTTAWSVAHRFGSFDGVASQAGENHKLSMPYIYDNKPWYYIQHGAEAGGGGSGYDTVAATTDLCHSMSFNYGGVGSTLLNEVEWTSKSMELGAEVQNKRIYSVRITYNTTGSGLVDDAQSFIGIKLALDGADQTYYEESGAWPWLQVSDAGKTVTLYKNGDPKLIETASVIALKVYSENPATNSASNRFKITDISVVFRPIDRLT